MAIIDTLGLDYQIKVDKQTLNVKGAELGLEADSEVRYALSVKDPSAANAFVVKLERNYDHVTGRKVGQDLASSARPMLRSQLTGRWKPARPYSRRIIIGDGDPFNGNEKNLKASIATSVVGDFTPFTKYTIKLIAKKGKLRRDDVDKTNISYIPEQS